MIRRTDRLIATHVLAATAIVWLLLIGFDVVTVFAAEAAEAGKGDFTLATAALSLAWTLPRRAYALYGNAAVIGSVLGLGTLAANSELTAMRAGGLSKARIAWAALVAIATVLALVVVVGETIGPWGEHRAEMIEAGAKAKELVATGKTGLWKREGNQLINAKRGTMGKNGIELGDVRVFAFADDGQLQSITSAKRAAHADDGWHLYDLSRQTFGADTIATTTAKDEPWPVTLEQRLLELSIVRPEHVATRDLAINIAYLDRNHMNSDALRSAYWQRIFYPLEVLLLAACTLPFAFGALRSGGFGRRLMIGVVLAIGWYFFQRGLTNVAGVYGIDHRLAHALPALLLFVAAVTYFRRRA